ncbi:DUF2442 domain-containing protein [Azospirillum sp.]|uniref:DUF2442 domain-containing protein n=1 Tax=Azospirillum sp. TaxID=34012 RepID=UPI003D72E77C
MRSIAHAKARDDLTVEIDWCEGGRDVVDLRPVAARGGVFAALADPAFFVAAMTVENGGYGLVWPRTPATDDEVGGIDISADSLWYRAHPEEWRKDYGPLDSAAD